MPVWPAGGWFQRRGIPAQVPRGSLGRQDKTKTGPQISLRPRPEREI